MNMGEPEPMDDLEDDIEAGGEISSLGHGELEQVREMRHYARLAAWDMPLLASTLSNSLNTTSDCPFCFHCYHCSVIEWRAMILENIADQ